MDPTYKARSVECNFWKVAYCYQVLPTNKQKFNLLKYISFKIYLLRNAQNFFKKGSGNIAEKSAINSLNTNVLKAMQKRQILEWNDASIFKSGNSNYSTFKIECHIDNLSTIEAGRDGWRDGGMGRGNIWPEPKTFGHKRLNLKQPRKSCNANMPTFHDKQYSTINTIF